MRIGTDIYGLRIALKAVRANRSEVKGEHDSYAKGFRDAIRHCERDILYEIEETKKAVAD